MSVKASISISDRQESFARKLVENGRFASLSAVVQHGLELVREETQLKEAELAALRNLLSDRQAGEFLTIEESQSRIEEMLSAKKAAYGL
ncbi:type II toxin-antitoxin system ParD family antitoxin [Neorhizobium sp. P12A]|uniref:ribbon-helix-helix domain-containing protein n=1 Tax=Neorhizobium sp. P12A TaxID=2268027 RepID=UPI0011EBA1EF|nr:type II toxin-antitoxin system ParD family antitoxin [Neorhizobium sp. P12A]KAA0689178.1 type II toxin-antitoxin system ParD family antitoxin [Neorhizobium sp. P12A]